LKNDFRSRNVYDLKLKSFFRFVSIFCNKRDDNIRRKTMINEAHGIKGNNIKSNINQAQGADRRVKMFKGTCARCRSMDQFCKINGSNQVKMFKGTRTRCKTAHGAGGSLGTVLAGRVHTCLYMSRLKVQKK
jgi:hypothetical protein